MSTKFTATDPRGIQVSCDEARWNGHICSGDHTIMQRNEKAVVETIQNPDLIYTSSQIEESQVYFKVGATSTYDNALYTKVIVKISGTSGNVVTAFPVSKVKGGIADVPIYKR